MSGLSFRVLKNKNKGLSRSRSSKPPSLLRGMLDLLICNSIQALDFKVPNYILVGTTGIVVNKICVSLCWLNRCTCNHSQLMVSIPLLPSNPKFSKFSPIHATRGCSSRYLSCERLEVFTSPRSSSIYYHHRLVFFSINKGRTLITLGHPERLKRLESQ